MKVLGALLTSLVFLQPALAAKSRPNLIFLAIDDLNTMANAYAVRHENWVLIAHKTGAHSNVPAWFDRENGYSRNVHPSELYDLRHDLAQKHNLYAEKPDKVRELTALLEQIRAKGQLR